jgi:hypothetical protein
LKCGNKLGSGPKHPFYKIHKKHTVYNRINIVITAGGFHHKHRHDLRLQLRHIHFSCVVIIRGMYLDPTIADYF